MRIAKIAAVAAFLGAFAAPGMASAYDYCWHVHDWRARQHCEWQRRHSNYYHHDRYDHDGRDQNHDHDHDHY